MKMMVAASAGIIGFSLVDRAFYGGRLVPALPALPELSQPDSVCIFRIR
jgi:hypothetical protein